MTTRQRLLLVLTATGGLIAAAALISGPSRASSDKAWAQFRTDVETRCREAGADILDSPSVTVDPFGSERFGLAVMTGVEKGASDVRSVVCVYDKATRTAEVGGPLDLATISAPPVEATLPVEGVGEGAPFGGTCAEECEASLSMLSDSDREAVIGLPDRIRRTLDAIDVADADGETRPALDVATLLAGDAALSGPLDAPEGVEPGERDCTLRWFGFLDEGARTVGSHACRVSKESDGTLVVEKTTGERFRVRLVPLTDTVSAYVGRSFLPGQPEREYDLQRPVNAANANFGNVVGLATVHAGHLHLIGGAELGMQPQDGEFFSVLTLSPS